MSNSNLKNKKQAGFTFVEAILQLTTFMIIMTTILLIFPWYEKTEETILATHSIEFEVFLSELSEDLVDAVEIKPLGNTEFKIKRKIVGDSNHFTFIHYQFSNQTIKKNHGINGVDIKLTRVKKLDFSLADNQFTLNVQFMNNLRKERSIVF